MKTLTIKEFVEDQESILKRVEKGEKIAVTDGEVSAVLVASDEYIYKMNNSDGPQLCRYIDGFQQVYMLKIYLHLQRLWKG